MEICASDQNFSVDGVEYVTRPEPSRLDANWSSQNSAPGTQSGGVATSSSRGLAAANNTSAPPQIPVECVPIAPPDVPEGDAPNLVGNIDVDALPMEFIHPCFHAPVDGLSIVLPHAELIFPTSQLQGRLYERRQCTALTVGNAIAILGFNDVVPSFASLLGPVVIYLVVNRLPDNSVDALRAFTANAGMRLAHPNWITFLPNQEDSSETQNSVIILNDSAIRTGSYPPSLAELAVAHQITLVGSPAPVPAISSLPTASALMLYETTDSQLKRDSREEKLNALYVLMRGDPVAVSEFVGPARDLGHESVLSRIHTDLPVIMMLMPWASTAHLALTLQCQFGPSYQTVKGRPINITAQHFFVPKDPQRPNMATKVSSVTQMALGVQNLCDCLALLFCSPGSPLFAKDTLFFHSIFMKMMNQLRNTSCQEEYLEAIPIDRVMQALNLSLTAFGKFLRTRSNALLSFEDFRTGAAATLDLYPHKCVMGAFTAMSSPALFIPPQFTTFDGTAAPSLSTFPVPAAPKRNFPTAHVPIRSPFKRLPVSVSSVF